MAVEGGVGLCADGRVVVGLWCWDGFGVWFWV